MEEISDEEKKDLDYRQSGDKSRIKCGMTEKQPPVKPRAEYTT